LVRWVVFDIKDRERQEVVVNVGQEEILNIDEPPPPLDDLPTEVPAVAVPGLDILDPTPLPEAVLTASLEEPQDMPDTSPLDVDPTHSKLIFKTFYPGRTEEGRAEALRIYNPTWGAQTEAAVLKALEWLKKNQAPDGSWGPNRVGMTGLALLTFLAHGETTASANYGNTVQKAIQFLVSQQDADGYFSRSRSGGGDSADSTCYAHAIATYAICEAYSLTRIAVLKPVMEKAVQVILDGQQAKGGWNYRFAKSMRRDTSVSGWMVQALKSAQIAGAENAGLAEALARAVADLLSVRDPATGRFGYTDARGGSLGCSGIGVLCLQLLGHAQDKEARQGLMALRAAKVAWASEREEGWPLYEWYYITQAKFHHGGQTWTHWNNQFARAYTKRQNEDGSWPAASKTEQSQGSAYATTFAALTLQVYYRQLPTFRAAATAPQESRGADEAGVQVL
ncbi:MAG: terpene cyclase/mutase family protein, partial [Kiritimatiellae bacterium]|nr:terpene cyclase/mutase family protein [Kiritimatiellia bacterium]